jgi:ammonia channel protein AmtB
MTYLSYCSFSVVEFTDFSGSMFVHVFGAYFRFAVSFVLHRSDTLNSSKEKSNYTLDIFSMIGT